MRKYVLAVTVVAGIAISFLGGIRSSNVSGIPVDATPLLIVDADKMDLGTVGIDPAFELVLPITNTSSQTVRVSEFRESCQCTDVSPASFSIASGETLPVRFTLDLTASSERSVHEPSWDFNSSVVPVIENNRGPPIVWKLQGTVRNAFELETPILRFGSELVEGEAFPEKQTHGTCKYRLSSIKAMVGEQDSHLIEAKAELSDGRTFTVTVRPASTLKSGRYESWVALSATKSDGVKLPVGGFRVSMQVATEVEVLPAELHFGLVRRDRPAKEEVTLTNRLGNDFQVLDVEVPESSGIAVANVDSQDRKTTFGISVAIPQPGRTHETVRFRVKSVGRPASWVTLPVTYRHHDSKKDEAQ